MRFHTLPRITVRVIVVLAAVFFTVGQPIAQAAIPAEPTAGVGAVPQMTLDLRQVSVEDGTMLEYRISYVNTGDETASDVVITNRLPDGAQLVSDSISDGGQVTDDGQAIRWEIGEVPIGGEGTVSYRVYLILLDATPTPEPTATRTFTPTSTPTREPTATPVPTYTPSPTHTPMPTPTSTSTATPQPTATVTPTPTATPPLQEPDANPDTYEVDEDTRLTVPPPGVLANDGFVPWATPRARLVDNPARARNFVLNENGGFTYLPEANYYGSDSFDYEMCVAPGLCDISHVTITINPVNDPPKARDDYYQMSDESSGLVAGPPGILENDTDVDGDSLEVTDYTEPSHGSLGYVNGDGGFYYVPEAGFLGVDSFRYRVSDGTSTAMATVYIRIIPTFRVGTLAEERFVLVNQGAMISWTWDGNTYSAESNPTIWPPSLFLPMIVK